MALLQGHSGTCRNVAEPWSRSVDLADPLADGRRYV